MIDSILRFSLTHRALVLVAALGLLLWGAWHSPQMPVDVFPDLTAPSVTVLTEGPGMAPEELEQRVTLPIERALNGTPGVRRVRSNTTVGISMVWVDFDYGTDPYRARQLVAEKLQVVAGELPRGVEAPALAPQASIMGEILFVALTAATEADTAAGSGQPSVAVTRADLLLQAESNIRRRLLSVDGVAQVVLTGGARRQIEVVIRPEALAAWGLTVDQVMEALDANNQGMAGGFIIDGAHEYIVYGTGRLRDIDDVGNVLVTLRDDRPVLVRDIGTVRVGEAVRRGDGSLNTREAVIIGIQKQPGINTMEVTRRVERELDAISAALPPGFALSAPVLRQADFIEVSLHNLREALRDGIFLVIVIVTIFLASLRASAITMVAIPLSLVAAILVLSATGSSLNTMTLGGLAIAIGELVDDAVIDVENVVRRLRQNALLGDAARPALRVVYDASREIRGSIVYATSVVVLVFSPLFLLTGVEGSLLRPLGVAYVVALLASLGVAITVTPALCSLFLPKAEMVRQHEEPRLIAALQRWYQRPVRAALAHPYMVGAVAVTLVLAAGVQLSRAGRSFLPEFAEGALTIGAMTLPGTALDASAGLSRAIEGVVLEFPEVVSVARRTGRAENDEHAIGTNFTEFEVMLRPTERSSQEFIAELRARLALFAGVNITVGQPISHRIDHMVSGTRAAVAVKVFGDDLAAMRATSEAVERAMSRVDGVVDLYREQASELPFIRIQFDYDLLARYGLAVADVEETIEAATGSHPATWISDHASRTAVVVRFGPDEIRDIEALRDLTITSPSGAVVELGALARIERSSGANEISREDVRRKIVVSANVAGRDLQSAVEDIRKAIEANVPPVEGIDIQYGGQFESAASARQTLTVAGIAAIIGMFLLLMLAFGSARDALLVMLNLPLALVGGVVGVMVAGNVVSVASIVGFITLFGIATRNGIMLVAHIRHLVDVEHVTDPEEAVIRGATERLAPILMTAIAAGIGLVPLAFKAGEPGSEILAPMASVILGGLVTATALNMFVVPALYRRLGDAVNPRRGPARARLL